jgi:cold-inducible RNA-binding protein
LPTGSKEDREGYTGRSEIGRRLNPHLDTGRHKEIFMKRIYVGNLSSQTTAAQLQGKFEKYSTVQKAELVCEGTTGKPLGFAYVLMGNDREGDAAIHELHRRRIGCQAWDVREAVPPVYHTADPLSAEKRNQRRAFLS